MRERVKWRSRAGLGLVGKLFLFVFLLCCVGGTAAHVHLTPGGCCGEWLGWCGGRVFAAVLVCSADLSVCLHAVMNKRARVLVIQW